MNVALLCIPCHTRIEHSGHERMYEAVSRIIDTRSMRITGD